MQTAHHFVDSKGVSRSRGLSALKQTQAYPVGFGMTHALAFHEHTSEHPSPEATCDLASLASGSPPVDAVDDLGCFMDLDLHQPNFWHSNLDAEKSLPLSSGRREVGREVSGPARGSKRWRPQPGRARRGGSPPAAKIGRVR